MPTENEAEAPIICGDCGDATEDPCEVRRSRRGPFRSVCEACREDNYVRCAHCEQWLPGTADWYAIPDNERLCGPCWDESSYRTCEHCCEAFDLDVEGVSHPDGYFCSDCIPEEDEEPASQPHYRRNERPISPFKRPWTGKHRSITPGKMPTLLLSGVEIEAEGPMENHAALAAALPPEMGIDEDGSLDSAKGVEIVTPPASGTEFEKYVRAACKALEAGDYSADSDACSVHTHVEVPFGMDKARLMLLLQMGWAVEDVVLAMMPKRRVGNHYATPLRHDYTFWSEGVDDPMVKFYGTFTPQDSSKYHDTRYHGMNLHSLRTHGTVEFRYHEGSLDVDAILGWVGFCQSLVAWAWGQEEGFSESLKFYEARRLAEMTVGPTDFGTDRIEYDEAACGKKVDAMARILRWPPALKGYVLARIAEHGAERGVVWDGCMEDGECKKGRARELRNERADMKRRERVQAAPSRVAASYRAMRSVALAEGETPTDLSAEDAARLNYATKNWGDEEILHSIGLAWLPRLEGLDD